MSKRTFITFTLVLTGACGFFFNIFYNEAKNTAITKLNEEQMIHVKQAARGIEDFFATLTGSLNALSQMNEIIDTDAVGKHSMTLFYEAHQEQIKAITRLDERGVILYNFPSSSSVGADILEQKHVPELLRDHKPVISDVFKAVEGFDAVALLVPVFRGPAFKGSIGILIDFEKVTKRYLDVIKIGATGYAWVVSHDGTQLYSPIPGFTGKSVFENIKGFPALNAMVNDMLKGHEGTAIYTFNRIGDRNVGQFTKYAAYMPVHVGKTFWSIAVASAEQDVLFGLISFRNKLAFAIGALFICGMVYLTLGVKAGFIKKLNAELEQRVKERTAELEFSNRVMESFSYSVSHDLKASIRAIEGFSRMLLGEDGAKLDAEGLQVVYDNTKRMHHLIGGLLALSRVGRLQIRKSVINLPVMVWQIFDQLRAQTPERGLRLTVDDLPPALGDQSLLHQVMMNLLANAVKFTKSRKTAVIEVGGWTEGKEDIYYVKDNGVGYDERYADKLFGVFQHLHGADEFEGTGVGLSIVKRIVQRHGGRVWAEGKLGEGATFYLSLPKNGE